MKDVGGKSKKIPEKKKKRKGKRIFKTGKLGAKLKNYR